MNIIKDSLMLICPFGTFLNNLVEFIVFPNPLSGALSEVFKY